MAERRFRETIGSREHEAALLRDDGRRIDLVLHVLGDYPEAGLGVVKPVRPESCGERWKAILLRIGVEPLFEDPQIEQEDARAGQGKRPQVVLKRIERCVVISMEAGLKSRRPNRTRSLTNGFEGDVAGRQPGDRFRLIPHEAPCTGQKGGNLFALPFLCLEFRIELGCADHRMDSRMRGAVIHVHTPFRGVDF